MKNIIKNTDFIIVIVVIILVAIGLFGIYSAGYNTDSSKDEYIKQFVWFGVSIMALIVIWLIPYNISSMIGIPAFVISLILLVAVLFTSPINGATSWFNLGTFLFQPSEIMKIAYILVLGKFIEYTLIKDKKGVNKWYNLSIIAAMFIVPVLLILKQPDMGTAAVFASITFFMLYKGGLNYKYILIALLVILLVVPLIYTFALNDIQKARITVFMNPEQDPLGTGYNAIQSKMAIGSGMIFGTGFLKGTQTQFGYLPVKSSDFIFAVISEEFGLIVSVVVIVLYAVLLIRIINISKTSRDKLGSLISIGVFGMIFFHLLENVGMTMGLMPITGIPLPFVSYGGSSLLTNFIAIGLVISISSRRQKVLFVD